MHCYLCFVRYTYSGSIDPNSRYIVMSAKLWVIRGSYDLLSIIHNTFYMQIPLREARVAPLSSHFISFSPFISVRVANRHYHGINEPGGSHHCEVSHCSSDPQPDGLVSWLTVCIKPYPRFLLHVWL